MSNSNSTKNKKIINNKNDKSAKSAKFTIKHTITSIKNVCKNAIKPIVSNENKYQHFKYWLTIQTNKRNLSSSSNSTTNSSSSTARNQNKKE